MKTKGAISKNQLRFNKLKNKLHILERRIGELEIFLKEKQKNDIYLQNMKIRNDKTNALSKFYPLTDKEYMDPDIRLRILESTPVYYPKSESVYYSMDDKSKIHSIGSSNLDFQSIDKDGAILILYNNDANEMIKDGIDIKRNDVICDWLKEFQNKSKIKWDEKRDAIYGNVIVVYENDKAPF